MLLCSFSLLDFFPRYCHCLPCHKIFLSCFFSSLSVCLSPDSAMKAGISPSLLPPPLLPPSSFLLLLLLLFLSTEVAPVPRIDRQDANIYLEKLYACEIISQSRYRTFTFPQKLPYIPFQSTQRQSILRCLDYCSFIRSWNQLVWVP